MLQNVRAGCRKHAAACAEHVASSSLPGLMRYSRAYVAATILSSLITFCLAPSIGAAQSHLPQCPSERNQIWTDCTGVYSFLMEVCTLVNSETTKEMDKAHSRLPMETNTSANGGMTKKMERALIHFSTVTNTSADGGIAKETDEARKLTLMEVNTLVSSGTMKGMDRARSPGPMERNTLVNSGTTYKMDRARIRFPMEGNT